MFQDGLGERRRISDITGAETLEMLCLRGELTAIPSFEFALRERASRLANFRHAYYSHVRSVDRLNDTADTLAIVSESIKGVRLSNLLAANEKHPLTLDINAALHLIRQIVSAVALLHENARDVAHGAIGPERIIVTPMARVVIVEYVLGAALEQLHFSRERYWKELRIALPSSPGLPRFDHRADVTEVGVVALSLILGRLLREEEYPGHLGEALASASAVSTQGELQPLSHGLRAWLARALQMDDVRHSFTTAVEARDALDRVLSATEEDEAEEEGEEAGEEDPEDQAGPIHIAQTSRVKAEAPRPEADRTPQKADSSKRQADVSPRSGASPGAEAHPPAPATRVIRQVAAAVVSPPVAQHARPSPQPPARTAATARHSPPPLAPRAPSAEAHDHVEEDEESDTDAVKPPRRWGRMAAVAVALVAVSTAGVIGARKFMMGGRSVTPTGTLVINTNPPGAQVVVDGQTSGVTPLTVTLTAGNHLVELRGAAEPRMLPVTITAGTQVSQYVELPKAPTAFGQLQIRTEPAGAQVTVDGIPRGKSPVFIEALAAGEHVVVLESDLGIVRQSVSIEAAQTSSLVVPLAATDNASASGWISISPPPVELQLYEKGRLVGTSQSERLMMPAGKHEIEMVNENVGYRAVRTIQVLGGKITPVSVEWPKGTISINALPWADVWIDGERVGETPIGNHSLAIGPHELVFRHPELGEQKYAVTVSLKAPVRVSLDLRKKP